MGSGFCDTDVQIVDLNTVMGMFRKKNNRLFSMVSRWATYPLRYPSVMKPIVRHTCAIFGMQCRDISACIH